MPKGSPLYWLSDEVFELHERNKAPKVQIQGEPIGLGVGIFPLSEGLWMTCFFGLRKFLGGFFGVNVWW